MFEVKNTVYNRPDSGSLSAAVCGVTADIQYNEPDIAYVTCLGWLFFYVAFRYIELSQSSWSADGSDVRRCFIVVGNPQQHLSYLTENVDSCLSQPV